jgi:hypothetical protein
MQKEIVLNSANRLSGTPDRFTLPLGKVKRMKLTWADVPASFDTFAGCQFQIRGSDTWTVTVPPGRYTITEFTSRVHDQISNIPGQAYAAEATPAGGLRVVSETESFTVLSPTWPVGWTGNSDVWETASLAHVLKEPFLHVCCDEVRGIDNGIVVAGKNLQNIIHAVPFDWSDVKYSALDSPWVYCFGDVQHFYLSFQNFPVLMHGANWACKFLVEY